MNRRQFLTRALAGIPLLAAPVALLEALEPKRTIFLPPRGGWGGVDSFWSGTLEDGAYAWLYVPEQGVYKRQHGGWTYYADSVLSIEKHDVITVSGKPYFRLTTV